MIQVDLSSVFSSLSSTVPIVKLAENNYWNEMNIANWCSIVHNWGVFTLYIVSSNLKWTNCSWNPNFSAWVWQHKSKIKHWIWNIHLIEMMIFSCTFIHDHKQFIVVHCIIMQANLGSLLTSCAISWGSTDQAIKSVSTQQWVSNWTIMASPERWKTGTRYILVIYFMTHVGQN